MFGIINATRSPFFSPCACSHPANASAAACVSAKVIVLPKLSKAGRLP